jgi:hypothetical protein
MSHGVDQSLLYVRNEEVVSLPDHQRFPYFVHDWIGNVTVYTHVIGFCGKIYPCLQIRSRFCHTPESVDEVLKEVLSDHQFESYTRDEQYFGLAGFLTKQKGVRRFFEECKKKESDYTKYFEDKRCPIFVATKMRNRWEVAYNALLNRLEFYRVFDPFRAFQEVRMFMSNMAMPEKPLPQLDDVTLAESKGYNKWSFRKEPTKR